MSTRPIVFYNQRTPDVHADDWVLEFAGNDATGTEARRVRMTIDELVQAWSALELAIDRAVNGGQLNGPPPTTTTQ